jgi:hypothetical protein
MNSANNQEVKQTLIRNVRIFNGLDEELLEGNILIENNLIKEISVSDQVNSSNSTIIESFYPLF